MYEAIMNKIIVSETCYNSTKLVDVVSLSGMKFVISFRHSLKYR